MQKNTTILVAIGCLVLLLIGGYSLFWPDEDEEMINRNLVRLIKVTEKSGEETLLITVRHAHQMVSYFTEDPSIWVGDPLPPLRDRGEMEGVFMEVRRNLQSLSIRIVSNELVVTEDGQRARMDLEAEANVSYGGEHGRERRAFSIDWIKQDGDWLIERVELESIAPRF